MDGSQPSNLGFSQQSEAGDVQGAALSQNHKIPSAGTLAKVLLAKISYVQHHPQKSDGPIYRLVCLNNWTPINTGSRTPKQLSEKERERGGGRDVEKPHCIFLK